ncbi:MAG: polyphosphate kinase 1 [Proteobacteria bacterium]|jgi:polyphosphate kinase|nr:polyphosphate kinase 1 [Pseudomonadota bacterium]
MVTTTSNDQEIMLNRELGLIQFYRRVLAQVTDDSVPLLEKINYLCIVSKNCDEFFEVRVARLLKWNKDHPNKLLPDGLTANNALSLVRGAVVSLYDDIYRVYHSILIPQLRKADIVILPHEEWNTAQQKWANKYFINELKPVLTPISIDPAHPFPRIPNKNLHFAVELEGIDQYGRNSKIAIVEAPRILHRVIKLPEKLSDGKDTFVLLQDIIKLHVDEFFYGLNVKGCYPFRVTRNAQINLKNDSKNLRLAVTNEIQNRKYAECSRLELDITSGMPNNKLINILLNQFNISEQDLYLAQGPVNLSRLQDITKMIKRDELRFAAYTPGIPEELIATPDIFAAMSKSDILIHTPYQSFEPLIELTRRAAEDPDVLAVKMTVYRTGTDSELAQNLIKAAKAGKQVVASIELFARFDEEANVELAKMLENAGAHVVYGVMGYKVHAKMLLIVRKENGILKQYVHLGSGNYHQATAKVYSDFGLLTTNPEIVHDVDNLFAQITGVGKNGILKKIYQAPFNLFELILEKIEHETINALNGKPAKIIAKMNSLLENQVIRALYKASQAGVKIDLIIRGSCALRPGIPGLSENIQVRSIVGRFLEHHRVFCFYNSGANDVYISSADWMKRNFFRRVETCIPILNKKIKRRIITESLTFCLKDNVGAWIMDKDGNYSLVKNKRKKFSSQAALMEKLGTTNTKDTI